MQIETYEIEEVTGELGNMAADSEAIELIEKLGLEGQKSLINTGTDTRFPYPRMNKIETFVYGNIFSARDPISKFTSGIIPLRVLQIAAFCKEFEQVAYLEVWHTGDPHKDPILVGRKSSYDQGENFIMARWGEALEPFEQLQAKARDIYAANMKSKLSGFLGEIKGILENVDNLAQTAALTGDAVNPQFWK